MSTTTKADLVEAVYRRIGISYAEAARLVDCVFEEIVEAMKEEERVKIKDFASFVIYTKDARVGRNPKTGTLHAIEPRRVISFVPSNHLKEEIDR